MLYLVLFVYLFDLIVILKMKASLDIDVLFGN